MTQGDPIAGHEKPATNAEGAGMGPAGIHDSSHPPKPKNEKPKERVKTVELIEERKAWPGTETVGAFLLIRLFRFA